MAYESQMAAALSGATLAQLSYWRREGLLIPEVSASRPLLYSYQDVVALRTFVYLREKRSLQKIRRALNTLRNIGELQHLSEYRLVEQGRGSIVLVYSTGDGAVDLVEKPGQHLTVIKLRDVFEAFPLGDAVVPSLTHPRDRISVDPGVRRGYPVVSGTRVSYDLVAGLVKDGVPPGEIRRYYPGVTAAAARDAVDFAEYVERSGRRRAA